MALASPTASAKLKACLLLILIALSQQATGCYTAIFAFGDSVTDTGNLVLDSPPNDKPHFDFPPYGETYFHHPTGRCSDGRLVVDFMAEYFGLPLVPPYSAVKNESRAALLAAGVNFAVVGAPAMDADFYAKFGIADPITNDSLRIQLNRFKELLPSLCDTSSSCKSLLERSLILLGPFGANDYTHSFPTGKLNLMKQFMPLIAKAIASATTELIDLGARTIIVPGIFPAGCFSYFLTVYETSNVEDYDTNGCIRWLNQWAAHHNELVQNELQLVQQRHPHATIIYADYYNIAMPLFHSPAQNGFTEGTLIACCGAGGKYNYNASAQCGFPPSKGCDHPSLHVDWDGVHLTEAANRFIFKGLLEGPNIRTAVTSSCLSFTSKIESF